ncbi:cytochrome c peroxidase [Paludisphaera sp.]|uniref:cytochrome c peroxidase n=1 Tax=Paludisphaera sp. TaxID=2017432 RepID=UPI00301D4638
MNHRRRLVAALALASAALAAGGVGRAQQPPRPSEPGSGHPHLVGHEDAELLRRVQQVIDDHDPRKLRNPYVETVDDGDPAAGRWSRHALRRPDLTEFIADVDAAMALGKALYWDMQAGSDFGRRKGPDGRPRYSGVACASCHFRFGVDPRDTGARRIPYVAWDRYQLDEGHEDLGFGEVQQPVDAEAVATHQITSVRDLKTKPPGGDDKEAKGEEDDEDNDEGRPRTPLSLIIGSQGVEPLVFKSLVVGNRPPEGDDDWNSEQAEPRDPGGFHRPPEWSMFLADPTDPSKGIFRQITTRNSPTVVNSAFADRLFHDVRAESTFNGFSIFGDHDPRGPVIHVRRPGPDGKPGLPAPVRVAVPLAALASQAVGPVVNDVEMSYVGRTFHDLAGKLLDAPVLGYQRVDRADSLLGRLRACDHPADADGLGGSWTYRALIRQAFRREWWDGADESGKEQPVSLNLAIVEPGDERPTGTLMDANFSLYWGLSVMLYEASLVSNKSPHDDMLRGRGEAVEELWGRVRSRIAPVHIDRVDNPAEPRLPEPVPRFEFKSGAEVYQRGLRVFLGRGCVDCHDGPLFSEIASRDDARDVEVDGTVPIARQVRNALLPVSRGDALNQAYVGAREGAYRRILRLVATAGAPSPFGRRELLDVARLLDRVGGDEADLARELQALFGEMRPAPPAPARLAADVARTWTTFEKTFPLRLGRRHAFTEDQRIELAARIAEPLLIELMPLPPNRAAFRPPWPIPGPTATDPYFFYDLSVYALGAGLPRYDRGAGDWRRIEAEAPHPAVARAAVAEIARQLSQPQPAPAPGREAAEAEDGRDRELNRLNDVLARKYGVVVSEKFRRRFRRDIGPLEEAADPAGRERSLKALAEPQDPSQAETLVVAARRPPEHPASPGRAYRLDARTTQGTSEPDLEEVAKEFRPRQPGDVVQGPWPDPAAADREARAARPRDLSWLRNLPNWDRDPALADGQEGFDSLDLRRADVHFFSRSRRLVQTESSEGRRKPLLHDDELAFWGSFKTPTLRNVALTPPYMHNGRIQTLFDVMDFYDRGGDVPPDRERNPDMAPAMARLGLDDEDKRAVVFFLMCLTDPRVERDRAPFDHPSLVVANGRERTPSGLVEKTIEIRAVGAGGREGVPHRFPSHDDSERPRPMPARGEASP